MRLVVATLGSAGDLHPFLAVARAAVERGHQVLFLSQEVHRAEVIAQGVPFEAIVSNHDHERAISHPLIWHPVKGFGVLWRHVAVPAIDPTVAILERLCRQAGPPWRVLASPLVVGARLALDLGWPLRLTSAHTAPAGLRSASHPMFIHGRCVPACWPNALRRSLWAWLDHSKLQPMAAPMLNRWRAGRGLPEIPGSVFSAWIHSPQANVALFPHDFGPMPEDWPLRQPISFTGFPLYRGHAIPDLDAELSQWLAADADRPLLVAYPGSAPTPAASTIRALAAEAVKQGARCLELSAEDCATEPFLARRKQINLSPALSQAKLVLHHGGIGITAECLAAGRPQLTLPSAYDQFDNSWRLARVDPRSGRLRDSRQMHQLLFQRQQASTRVVKPEHSVPGAPNSAVQGVLDLLDS